jgi:hypothetical protein
VKPTKNLAFFVTDVSRMTITPVIFVRFKKKLAINKEEICPYMFIK